MLGSVFRLLLHAVSSRESPRMTLGGTHYRILSVAVPSKLQNCSMLVLAVKSFVV